MVTETKPKKCFFTCPLTLFKDDICPPLEDPMGGQRPRYLRKSSRIEFRFLTPITSMIMIGPLTIIVRNYSHLCTSRRDNPCVPRDVTRSHATLETNRLHGDQKIEKQYYKNGAGQQTKKPAVRNRRESPNVMRLRRSQHQLAVPLPLYHKSITA
jgi:hypothetical protein